MKRYLLALCLLTIATSLHAFEQIGVASWYGGIFQGKPTANGEIFNTHDLTAAHKDLPFNTIVTVTNIANGRSVDVRINDRGPFVGDRIIDLSYAAAKALDMVRDGTANVLIVTHDFDELTITYNIQVGAYKTLEYARDMKSRLEEAGFAPVAELGSNGVTRILLKGIPGEETDRIVVRLSELGIENPLVKQN